MIKKFFILSAMIGFVAAFTSCEKEENIISPEDTTNTPSILKSSSGTSFYIDESILQHFVHYCQRQAGPVSLPNYPNAEAKLSLSDATSACCATSYMMAAACLAHYKDGSSSQYNATGTKLAGIVSSFKNFSNGMKSIITARDYCNSTLYDGGWLVGTYLTPTQDRATAKTRLETYLSNNKFVLVPVSAYTTNYVTVNQDVLFQNTSSNPDLSSTASSLNYIKTSGGNGHVILVIRIDKNDNSSEGGVVTYIDPLSTTRSPSNRKYVSYKRFLDSMLANNSQSYPMTAIALK